MGDRERSEAVGAVLAGGGARRMGGEKAGAQFGGRPLIDYPIEALALRLDEVIVVAKGSSRLPELPAGVSRVDEPEEPRHPATGVIAALGAAAGRPVVILACDLPLVGAGDVDALLAEPAGGSLVVAGVAGGRVQPLVARYEPGARERLDGFDPRRSMTSLALGLGASLVAVGDGAARGANTVEELGELSRRLRS